MAQLDKILSNCVRHKIMPSGIIYMPPVNGLKHVDYACLHASRVYVLKVSSLDEILATLGHLHI